MAESPHSDSVEYVYLTGDALTYKELWHSPGTCDVLWIFPVKNYFPGVGIFLLTGRSCSLPCLVAYLNSFATQGLPPSSRTSCLYLPLSGEWPWACRTDLIYLRAISKPDACLWTIRLTYLWLEPWHRFLLAAFFAAHTRRLRTGACLLMQIRGCPSCYPQPLDPLSFLE